VAVRRAISTVYSRLCATSGIPPSDVTDGVIVTSFMLGVMRGGRVRRIEAGFDASFR
jgi:hypothetical protein